MANDLGFPPFIRSGVAGTRNTTEIRPGSGASEAALHAEPATKYQFRAKLVPTLASLRRSGWVPEVRRVLIIDDYDAILFTAGAGMKSFVEGIEHADTFRLTLKSQLPELLEKIKNGNYDLIICDGNMGEVWGEEVVARIRAADFGKQCYIMVNSSDSTRRDAMLTAGADGARDKGGNLLGIFERLEG